MTEDDKQLALIITMFSGCCFISAFAGALTAHAFITCP